MNNQESLKHPANHGIQIDKLRDVVMMEQHLSGP